MRPGAPGRTRTADAGLRTASLYPLSYGGAAHRTPPGGWEPRLAVDVTSEAASPCGGLSLGPAGGVPEPRVESGDDAALPSPTSSCTAAPGCHLCDETRELLATLLARPRAPGPARRPTLVERDIDDRPGLRARLLRSDPGRRARRPRLELAISAAKIRRLLADVLDAARAMAGTDLTILVAFARRAAQLPLAVRPAARPGLPRPADRRRGRRPAPRRDAVALARASATPSPTSPGSGRSSRCSGVTATFAAGPLVDYLPTLRQVGGVILDRPRPEPRRASSDPRPRPDLAAARRRRRELARDARPARSRSRGRRRRRPQRSATDSAAAS